MTSQQQADSALALYQANKSNPAIEALLDEFFNRPTADEYDRTLSRVSEEMACVTDTRLRSA